MVVENTIDHSAVSSTVIVRLLSPNMNTEKKSPYISSSPDNTDVDIGTVAPAEDHEGQTEAEVFGVGGEGQVEFRTVGWIRAAMFLIKQTFATGVLSIPSAMYYMGAVAACISIVFWGLLNTLLAYEQVSSQQCPF